MQLHYPVQTQTCFWHPRTHLRTQLAISQRGQIHRARRFLPQNIQRCSIFVVGTALVIGYTCPRRPRFFITGLVCIIVRHLAGIVLRSVQARGQVFVECVMLTRHLTPDSVAVDDDNGVGFEVATLDKHPRSARGSSFDSDGSVERCARQPRTREFLRSGTLPGSIVYRRSSSGVCRMRSHTIATCNTAHSHNSSGRSIPHAACALCPATCGTCARPRGRAVAKIEICRPRRANAMHSAPWSL